VLFTKQVCHIPCEILLKLLAHPFTSSKGSWGLLSPTGPSLLSPLGLVCLVARVSGLRHLGKVRTLTRPWMGYVDCGRLPKKNSTYLVVGATVLWPIGSAAQENDPSSRARGRHGSQLRAPCVFQVADQRQHPDRERKRITQPLQHSFFSNNARRQHHARRSTCPTASRGPGPNRKRKFSDTSIWSLERCRTQRGGLNGMLRRRSAHHMPRIFPAARAVAWWTMPESRARCWTMGIWFTRYRPGFTFRTPVRQCT
jgi:hypothetical protein